MNGRVAVSIVDYGMGNLRSVANAFAGMDCVVTVASEPAQLAGSTHVVLPGVGAFGDGMAALRRAGWDDALGALVSEAVPTLGICLGMQLLASVGHEHGCHDGLGWVPGEVDRLQIGEALRVPHVGWNEVDMTRPCSLLQDLGDRPAFYFVHSYAFHPAAEEVVTGTCAYGPPFVATLHRENVFGVQFHPEKSHRTGLRLLENFLRVSPATLCCQETSC